MYKSRMDENINQNLICRRKKKPAARKPELSKSRKTGHTVGGGHHRHISPQIWPSSRSVPVLSLAAAVHRRLNRRMVAKVLASFLTTKPPKKKKTSSSSSMRTIICLHFPTEDLDSDAAVVDAVVASEWRRPPAAGKRPDSADVGSWRRFAAFAETNVRNFFPVAAEVHCGPSSLPVPAVEQQDICWW